MQRAVVNAILLASGIGTLLGLAAISSALFFQAYLPHQVVTAPVYLQYGYVLPRLHGRLLRGTPKLTRGAARAQTD